MMKNEILYETYISYIHNDNAKLSSLVNLQILLKEKFDDYIDKNIINLILSIRSEYFLRSCYLNKDIINLFDLSQRDNVVALIYNRFLNKEVIKVIYSDIIKHKLLLDFITNAELNFYINLDKDYINLLKTFK